MIQVAAGVLSDRRGRVLLMQRLPGRHLAGLWEFPGGKLEPGESVVQALAREFAEELGIEVLASARLISIPWCYPEKSVRLHALRVTAWRGNPEAREGHALHWTALDDIDANVLPAADAPILAALRLPARYVIAPQTGSGSLSVQRKASPVASLEREPDPVSPLVQLRIPGAPRETVRQAAAVWLHSDPSLRARLLVNHDIELARELGTGVHVKSAQLRKLHARPLPPGVWVGASGHDAEELELAACLGADFATLSPVRVTASHPGATPLGWDRFARLVADARLPVYALGGVTPDDLEHVRDVGAQGVAGIRAFSRR